MKIAEIFFSILVGFIMGSIYGRLDYQQTKEKREK